MANVNRHPSYEERYSGVVWHKGCAVGIRAEGFIPEGWFGPAKKPSRKEDA